MQYVFACRCRANRAPASSSSSPSKLYAAIFAVDAFDCEQYPQSSLHPPHLAFTNEFKATLLPNQRWRTRYAAANTSKISSSPDCNKSSASRRSNVRPANTCSAASRARVIKD